MREIRIQPVDHIGSGEITSMLKLGGQLAQQAHGGHSGRAGRTVIALPGLRATLIALREGSELAEHRAPGAATLLCVRGQVTLSTGERDWKLGEDEIVAIPEELHSLHADTDAVVLITVRLAADSAG